MRVFFRLFPALCSMLCAASAGSTEHPTPRGVWLHDNGRIQVAISPCGERLCGKVVWLRNPNARSGKQRTDSRNPNPNLRDRPVLGLTVLSGLQRSGPNSWSNGTIYNPLDGNTYRCRITMQDNTELRVHAFVMLPILGRTITWRRVGGPENIWSSELSGYSG